MDAIVLSVRWSPDRIHAYNGADFAPRNSTTITTSKTLRGSICGSQRELTRARSMDAATLKTVWDLHKPCFFAPLGNMPHFAAIGIPASHVHLLDWWEESAVSVSLPSAPGDKAQDLPGSQPQASFVLTCTPAQHAANRTPFDRWQTLWASWAVTEDSRPQPNSARAPKQVYFTGDTGYRTVLPGEDEDAVPRCPAFAEVGERFGGFDLALIPIGAYEPRDMWSGLHASPADAVEIYKDIGARRAVGMHWGCVLYSVCVV